MTENRSFDTIARLRDAAAALALLTPFLILAVEGMLPLVIAGKIISLGLVAFVVLLMLSFGLTHVLWTVDAPNRRPHA